MLNNPADVDDAFQATFLILVRKARSLRDFHHLGPWLHGVAYRVAVRARADAVRRRALEHGGSRPESEPEVRAPDRVAVQAELRRPSMKRLRDSPRPTAPRWCSATWKGDRSRTRPDSWGGAKGPPRPVGSARRKLRDRLERRGIAPALLPATAPLLSDSVGLSVSSALIETTTRAGMATVLAGRAAPSTTRFISTSVATLVQGVIHTMALSKVKVLVTIVVLAGVGLLAAGRLVRAARSAIENHAAPSIARTARLRQAQKAGDEEPAKARGLDVSGRVRDGKGQPIAGAKVVLAYSSSGRDQLQATTDAAGRFVLIHPDRNSRLGRWSISVVAPGFAPSWRMVVPKGEILPVNFRLSPGRPFHGRVVDNQGRPVAGVSVSARWEECYSLDWRALTDAEGRFVWPDAPHEGEIEFNLGHPGYSRARGRTAAAAAGRADLTINPRGRVRGTVLDAESNQPVAAFTVIPATRFADDREINWQRRRGVKGSEGRYEIIPIPIDQPGMVYHLRIEAEGYAPAISRPIQPAEGEVVLHFALKKARGISGVVRLPEGTPAADADVYIDGDGYTYNRSTGPPPAPSRLDPGHRKTGPDGRYLFPPQDEPFGILAVHDKGFGDRTREEMAQSPDVTLKPWARIEGTFRIRGKPGVHQEIDVNLNRSVLPGRYRFQSYSATTDDQGRFVIDRILDGEADFTWLSGQRPTMTQSSAGPSVNLRPGLTVHVVLGGPGRPMVGQLVLAVPDAVEASDLMTGVHVANATGSLSSKPSQMPIPADFRTWDQKKQRAYEIKWYHTESGRAYMRTRRFHLFHVGADGRFRIEDVVPGSYRLSMSLASTPGMMNPLRRNRLGGRIERDVEVGTIPGGHSDEPLDLGKISLKLEHRINRPSRFMPPRQRCASPWPGTGPTSSGRSSAPSAPSPTSWADTSIPT